MWVAYCWSWIWFCMVSCYVLLVCPHGLLCDMAHGLGFLQVSCARGAFWHALQQHATLRSFSFCGALPTLCCWAVIRNIDMLTQWFWNLKHLHDVRIGSWNGASVEIMIKNALSKSKVLWRDTTQRGWWIAFAKSLPGGTEHHCSTADFHGFHAKLCAWHSGKWAPWAAKVGLFPASKFVSLHLC